MSMENYCTVRFKEFKRELAELQRGRTLNYADETFILKGIAKSFELLFDLSWKTMKDILKNYFGVENYSTGSPRENLEQAFKMGLIKDDATWLAMLKDRNFLAHDYDEAIARAKVELIINDYFLKFKEFEAVVEVLLKTKKPL